MNKDFKDKDLQYLLGGLLRIGVLVSMAIVAAGLFLFLIQYRATLTDFGHFNADKLFDFSGFLSHLKSGDSVAIIELGVLCLIATPVLRVVFAIIGFGKEKDGLYVLVSSLVLAIIVSSIFLGAFLK